MSLATDCDGQKFGAIDKLDELFSEKNALVWFMLFDKFVKTGLPDKKFGEFLNNFEKLKSIMTYQNGVVGSRRNNIHQNASFCICIPSYQHRAYLLFEFAQKFGFPQGIISMQPSYNML